MANVIRHKRGTSDPVAGDFSDTAELLINTTDGGLFTKTDGGSVVEIGAGGGGGGGLTEFVESQETASPNATTPVDALTATDASYTNIDVALVAKGTGATLAQVPDGTATGGNKRGLRATDLQKSRSNASHVANGNYSVIAGGESNTAAGLYSTVGGGTANRTSTNYSTVSGGRSNVVQTSTFATIAGGDTSSATGQYSFIGGGRSNAAAGSYGVVAGGYYNVANTSYAFIGGGSFNTTSGNTYTTVVGGYLNTASGKYSFVGGGKSNVTYTNYSFIGAGESNEALTNTHSAVVGGYLNDATGQYSFIGGGQSNVAGATQSFVGGGYSNAATGPYGSILGGYDNSSQNSYSAVLGGYFNLANGQSSTVVGGSCGSTRGIAGFVALPASDAPIAAVRGVNQSGLLVLGRQTTDATATALASNSSAPGTTNQLKLPNNSACAFKGTVIATVTGGGDTAAWEFKGAIKRGANAASTAIVGTVIKDVLAYDAGASSWDVAFTADTTNGGLKVEVTGAAATTIRWVAKLETTEVTY